MSVFITFEGPEGSGKTTQIKLLAEALEARGRRALATREPGGTRIGNAIRAVLLDSSHTEMSPRAEALLFNAARAQLVDQVIRPALNDGLVVLCDRYADSTLAYQGYGHDKPLAALETLGKYATDGLSPTLTIYLEIDPKAGLLRKQNGAVEEWNRMEELALAFHQAVHDGYLQLADAEPDRWLVIDASGDADAIAQVIWTRVESLCLIEPRLEKNRPEKQGSRL